MISLNIKLFDQVPNIAVWERTGQITVEQEIWKSRPKVEKLATRITRHGISWNPQGLK